LNTSMRPPDAVRISARGREILIKLKRYTGIGQWNTLCRLAYCYSLAISTEPTHVPEKGDCALEIEWTTFCGPIKAEITALTLWRSKTSAIAPQDLAKYVRAHVERGLGGIQNLRTLSELVKLPLGTSPSSRNSGVTNGCLATTGSADA
jgi:DNA sulfur modification protein DndE